LADQRDGCDVVIDGTLQTGEYILSTDVGVDRKAKSAQKAEPIRVLISGAAGQIGYSLIPEVASGAMFGPNQPVILHLLDIEPCLKRLQGTVLEIEDSCYPLVSQIIATTDVKTAFSGIQYALLTGGFPRGPGMERKDLIAKNSGIFVTQGKALSEFADKNCKVLVIANPANSNCLIAQRNCPNLPKENFSALTRLDMNRAKGQLGLKLNLSPDSIKNVIIWGNHSPTMVPDATNTQIKNQGVWGNAKLEDKWVEENFIPTIQQRGKKVIEVRGASSALSAARAIADHMKDWVYGTAPGEYVSMAVVSDGSYGITSGIIFSYPVTCTKGTWKIVQGLPVSDKIRALLKITEKELLDERADCPQ